MAASDGRELCSRLDKIKSDNAGNLERWNRMAPFIAPSRANMYGAAPGANQVGGVYDSTTMMAAELMAMFIAGHIINPSQQWHGYEMEDEEANKDDETREWLEECRNISLKRLGSSLFYAEGPESLIDYGGFGTGCLLAEEAPQPINRTIRGFRGFHFSAEKTGRFWIQEGSDGLVDTLFREYELTARVCVDRFKAANVGERIRAMIGKGEGDRPVKVIHAITPRRKQDQSEAYGNKGMPWAACWIDYESKHIMEEGGYRVFPAAVPRYHKTPNEVFGRGRGHIAYPDTFTLNTAKRMSFQDWALKIQPPILHGHDSVMGTLNLIPAGSMPINTHGRDIRQTIVPFETGSHPEVSQINEENLRKSIKTVFYVDQILALLEVQKSEMTAFEFARKIELLFRLLGPVYGRLEWEYLHRIVDITFDIQLYAKAFPPPPPRVLQTNGLINVRFQNPIAKAQRSGDAESLMMALGDAGEFLLQLKPEMLDRLDTDKAMKGVFDVRGVPASWQRSDKELAAKRQADFESNKKELEMTEMERMAGAAGKAAPALTALQGGKKK